MGGVPPKVVPPPDQPTVLTNQGSGYCTLSPLWKTKKKKKKKSCGGICGDGVSRFTLSYRSDPHFVARCDYGGSNPSHSYHTTLSMYGSTSSGIGSSGIGSGTNVAGGTGGGGDGIFVDKLKNNYYLTCNFKFNCYSNFIYKSNFGVQLLQRHKLVDNYNLIFLRF